MKHGSYFNETIVRSWCSLRSPNTPLEPKMKSISSLKEMVFISLTYKTVKKVEEAYNFIKQVSEDGGKVLFVGTKNKHKNQ